MDNFWLYCTSLLACVLLTLSTALQAAPWIEPGEARTRHHLTTLVDGGLMATPMTTWPVMWSSVKRGLDDIDPRGLTPQQLWSYQYLRHELRKAMAPLSLGKHVHAGSKATAITHFGTQVREQFGSSVNLNYMGDQIAYRIQGHYVSNASDDHKWRADGSYISYLWGNWAVGGGALDRWWGPGWETSMMLSHNARPAPGIFLQRNLAKPFETPLLSWLGPWQLTTFLSKLESNRHIADAQLWGMRASFRPLQSLEVGLSRTALWAGEGRPGNLETFGKLLVGRDRVDSEAREEDIASAPGSQLAGVDIRWGRQVFGHGVALYGQLVGEDEGADLPSGRIGLAGIEISQLIGKIHSRTSLEAHNSTAYFYRSDRAGHNLAYEHPVYESGYRYRNRPMGASTDNDTEVYTLRSQLYFDHGRYLNLSWAVLSLNQDDTGKPPPGGSVFGSGRTDTHKWSVQYTTPLNDFYKLSIGAFHFTERVPFQDFTIKSGAHLSVQAHW